MARGASVAKFILKARGKVDGKAVQWDVAVFVGERELKSYAALLNLAYKGKDVPTIKAMDVHSPATADGVIATDVKFSKNTVQYNPEPPALDDEAALL